MHQVAVELVLYSLRSWRCHQVELEVEVGRQVEVVDQVV